MFDIKVGLFFVVNQRIHFELTDISEASIYGDFPLGDAGHYDVWEAKHKKRHKKEYDHFPRGRVVFNKVSNVFIVYLVRCVLEAEKNKIVEMFQLEMQQVKFEQNQHYVCRKCNGKYIDL